MNNYIIRARSIDGTVWATRFGWSSEKIDAMKFTNAEAQQRVLDQRKQNAESNADDCIGKLEIIKVQS